jgi:uncharacterized LabA/DUF88 family protein
MSYTIEYIPPITSLVGCEAVVQATASAFNWSIPPMRTYIYVDGFNLYYGAVRNTAYKWLDIYKMCQVLLPKNQIGRIKYFTARIKPRPTDPHQPHRQNSYLRALSTIPNLEIIYGSFLTSTPTMIEVGSNPPRRVKVYKTEEKGSDVNIAAHMINDGHKGLYNVAVLVTNDSDLVEPMRIIRHELGLQVGVLNPHSKPSRELQQNATFMKPIRTGVLASCQFPGVLQDASGIIQKPASW